MFIRHRLDCTPQDLPDLLARSYEHPIWSERAAQCFSCGSCTMVCPTCYCFDVQDEVAWDLQQGERVRTWDACLLHDFAEVAGGHNFRRKRRSASATASTARASTCGTACGRSPAWAAAAASPPARRRSPIRSKSTTRLLEE